MAAKRNSNVRYDGNLAYNLEVPELFPDYTIDNPAERPTPPLEQPEVKAAPKEKQAFAPGAVLGTLCAGVLLVMMIMAQIQLAVLSNETVTLFNQVKALRLEEIRLKIAYESAVNLTEVETYAINELGMQKPRGDQIFYIDGTVPDKAVLHSESRAIWSGIGFLEKIKSFFS